jgi:cytidyltransferase-like protein
VKKVFVSGCFDILHGGHVEFFKQAKSLGDYLIVSFASDEVLWKYKHRKPSIPEIHKKILLESLEMVDEVVIGKNTSKIGLEFEDYFIKSQPYILAVTEDDNFGEQKKRLCSQYGVKYVIMPKNFPHEPISTTSIINTIRSPVQSPLRIDFAGGWLDVPKFSIKGTYVVNCAIRPLVDLQTWNYEKNSGVGGSAAWAYINSKNSIEKELNMGVGWQDPAIIQETGICVWRSGDKPTLECKYNPDWLEGKMALFFTGKHHSTKDLVDVDRNWDIIVASAGYAKLAVEKRDMFVLADAISLTYSHVQIAEGMERLPDYGEIAKKYCGSGHGGYAMYLFNDIENRDTFAQLHNAMQIEPYMRNLI